MNLEAGIMESIVLLYKTDDLLIISKPAEMLVHQAHIKNKIANSKNEISSEFTVADWLLEHYPEVKLVGDDPVLRPGIVHRLDRDTSGVMVIARTKSAFSYLKNLFQKHEIKKTYTALVWGQLKDERGVINLPISLKKGSTKRSVHNTGLLTKEAETHYRVLQRFVFGKEHLTLLAIEPKTGRTHQIRVHLNSLGHGIVGDKLYGVSKIKSQNTKMMGLERQFLHAESIEFTTPDGKRITVGSDLPLDLLQALAKLSPVPMDLHSHN